MFEKKSYGEFAKAFARETKIPLKTAKALVVQAEPKAKARMSKEITSPKKLKTLVTSVMGAAKEEGRRLYKAGRSDDRFRRDVLREANAAPKKEAPGANAPAKKPTNTAAFLSKIKSGSVLEQIAAADTTSRSPSQTSAPKPQPAEPAPAAPINDMDIG